jgi:molecular chaperone GrpE
MIVKQFYTFLEKEKVELMETIGNKFDPNMHEVLTQIESEEHEEDTVVQEYRKGYILNGRVMRAAQVVISKRPAGSDSPKKKPQKESTDPEPAKPKEKE